MKKLSEVPFDKIYVGMPVILENIFCHHCFPNRLKTWYGTIIYVGDFYGINTPYIKIEYRDKNGDHIPGYDEHFRNIHALFHEHCYNVFLDPTRM